MKICSSSSCLSILSSGPGFLHNKWQHPNTYSRAGMFFMLLPLQASLKSLALCSHPSHKINSKQYPLLHQLQSLFYACLLKFLHQWLGHVENYETQPFQAISGVDGEKIMKYMWSRYYWKLFALRRFSLSILLTVVLVVCKCRWDLPSSNLWESQCLASTMCSSSFHSAFLKNGCPSSWVSCKSSRMWKIIL